MKLAFTKMEALGNDFIVINALSKKITLGQPLIKKLTDRHFGIGADQVLIIEETKNKKADFHYRIFNADGSEAEQCINGVRCIGKYLYDKKFTHKKHLVLSSAAGITHISLEPNGEVTAAIAAPTLLPKRIPFLTKQQALHYKLKVAAKTIKIGALAVGNPHVILRVNSITKAPMMLAPLIAAHRLFPEGINVNFMEIVSPHHIKLRTYERGTGETLACGSGAAAAVAVGRLWKFLDQVVRVDLPFGHLTVTWSSLVSPIYIRGKAVAVFQGEIMGL